MKDKSCFNCANLFICYQRNLLGDLLQNCNHLDHDASSESGCNATHNLHKAMAESCTLYEYKEVKESVK